MSKLTIEEKKKRGTHRPSRDLEPKTFNKVNEIPEPPDYLNAYGREWYFTFGAELIGQGWLAASDIEALVEYCWICQAQEIARRAVAGDEKAKEEFNSYTNQRLPANFAVGLAEKKRALSKQLKLDPVSRQDRKDQKKETPMKLISG